MRNYDYRSTCYHVICIVLFSYWQSNVNSEIIDDIYLPLNATSFIINFDNLNETPEKRLDLPEFEFEVELTDKIIESINIDEVKEIIKDSKTLELIKD